MQLVIDTKEQKPLEFVLCEGVTISRESMNTGDYTARYDNGENSDTVIERKSLGDLFSSFTNEYENERAKIIRARDQNLYYILAVEASLTTVLGGYRYYKNGKWHESRKTGIAQIRQLMTMEHKYGMEVWYCNDRIEMSFRIQEFFLAHLRVKPEP